MIFVLSWYENIDLNVLQSTRDGSKWTTDPEHIRRRQEVAHSFVQYAPIHQFVDGPVPSDDEAEDDEEEYEAGSGDEDKEEVDEEIQADTPPPDSATGTATEPTAEVTATETLASPAKRTSDAAA